MAATIGLSDTIAHDVIYDPDSLVSALWREVPFTRLPPDAPAELREYVEEIRHPRQSYAVHSASRRHDFRDLVSRSV